MFQAGAVKVKHDLLLVVLQVNQSKTSPLKSTRKRTTARWGDILRDLLDVFVAQCTLVKKWRSALWLIAMHSGKKWSIREFELSLPSIYSFKFLFIMLLARSAAIKWFVGLVCLTHLSIKIVNKIYPPLFCLRYLARANRKRFIFLDQLS